METTLCERCSLLRFDDLAAGCREVVDEEGVARLSYEDAKVEDYYRRGPNLCEYVLIRLSWHLDDSFPHLPQLSNSSESGCNFCNSLRLCLNAHLDVLSTDYSIHDGPVSLAAYVSLRRETIEGLVVELVSNETEDEEGSAKVFFPIEASPGCHKWLGAEAARHNGYLTSENTREICRVLAECTSNCHPWEASFLPTRLIDIGTSLSDTPRLVLSSDVLITKEAKYAALSYCWGDEEDGERQLKTETATLEQRSRGIPWEIMTPAIKDAVELTRAIGLRYLWIDALCIIQDNPADWSYESGQMNSVYHHAFVTFCALVSTSCHESFLQRARTVSVPFQSALRPDINGYLLIRLEPLFGDQRLRQVYYLDRNASRWDGRAWTFQEGALSTRLLLFGASKMHFRCGPHQWSEGDDKLSHSDLSIVPIHDRITGIKQGKYPESSLYDAWYLFVHHYSNRVITHKTDRLPAMSGLARLVWETLGDQYLAGLWKNDILNGLVWSSAPSSYGLQNHLQNLRETYIAPSWSWAAHVGGGVWEGYPSCQEETVPECTILDVEVKTDLQNPFGRVYGGYLRISGKVAPVPSSFEKSVRDGQRSSSMLLDFDGMQEDIVARLDWHPRDDDEGLGNLVMLLLHYQQHPRPHTDDSFRQRNFGALILYPSETPDEYYRVGSVRSLGQAAYDLMRTWFEGETKEKVCTII